VPSDVEEVSDLPKFLFAQNHQRWAAQTEIANQHFVSGWAGRIAELWSGINSTVDLNISYFGNDRMLRGNITPPLILGGKDTNKV
jgi:hypothetical protein